MTASEHRARARSALKGNWPWAVLTSFVAVLLGAISSSGGGFEITLSETETIDLSGLLPGAAESILTYVLGGAALAVGLVSIVISVVQLIVGSATVLGYRSYLLDLMDGREPEFKQLFSQFHRLGQAVLLRVLVGLVIAVPLLVLSGLTALLAYFEMTVLAFVTGILALVDLGVMVYVQYGLEMTEFIMAEDESCGAVDAMKRSWTMMDGNRFRLWCLGLSFIGWSILASLTFGIGGLFLTPYVQMASASFYRELRPKAVPEHAVNDEEPPVYEELPGGVLGIEE